MGNKSKALKWLGKFLAEVLLNAAIQEIIDVLVPHYCRALIPPLK